jgi:uncharacterized protein YbjT (DUF2867 family)
MVLVTGATGNVGRHLVRELRDRGVPARAFVRDERKAAEDKEDTEEKSAHLREGGPQWSGFWQWQSR